MSVPRSTRARNRHESGIVWFRQAGYAEMHGQHTRTNRPMFIVAPSKACLLSPRLSQEAAIGCVGPACVPASNSHFPSKRIGGLRRRVWTQETPAAVVSQDRTSDVIDVAPWPKPIRRNERHQEEKHLR